MPVLLDRGPLGYRSFPAAKHLRSHARKWSGANYIGVGLINNMPDLALEQTERQILKLLDVAADDIVVCLKLFALPDLPRDDWARKHLSRMHYYGVDDLWSSRLDGLIITGAEPRSLDLIQEPYWRTLTKVFDWADNNTTSTILSCLAVHAAVYHFDGIGRHALDDKCFGVFEFERASSHAVVNGVPSRLKVPHSRWNELGEEALTTCGYDILFRAPDTGVDMFIKSRKSLFVHFQGHPEYEAWTLLAEYRRDIERFIKGGLEAYPTMPRGYFDEETAQTFSDLRDRALANRRMDLSATISTNQLAKKLTDPWHSAATQIYSNWLCYMVTQKAQRMKFEPSGHSLHGNARPVESGSPS